MKKVDFPAEDAWLEWKKRKTSKYGKNRASLKVVKIAPMAPTFKKSYPDDWEPWKKRKCDAGFEVGHEFVVEEGKKLVGGKVFCASAIVDTIKDIWGVTYDCFFPWDHEARGPNAYRLKGEEERERTIGRCEDLNHTVHFEIRRTKEK